MTGHRALAPLALAALASCATAPSIRVELPREPLPPIFSPINWTTTCPQLALLLGGPVAPTGDGRGCSASLERAPLGAVDLTLDFRAAPDRFTSATLVHRVTPACGEETPPAAGCGAEPPFDLTVAFAVLLRSVEQRLGPPLATLAEGNDRSQEWRQPDWTLTAGLYGPRRGAGWRIVLTAVPAARDAEGRQVPSPLPAAP
jgi:hypothetical protein